MAVMLGIYIPASLMAGRVCHAWNNRIGVVQVGSTLMFLAFAGILSDPSHVLLMILPGLFGVGYGWNVGPLLTLAIDKMPARNPATSIGVIFMCMWLGSAVAGSALGYLVEWFSAFHPVWVFAVHSPGGSFSAYDLSTCGQCTAGCLRSALVGALGIHR